MKNYLSITLFLFLFHSVNAQEMARDTLEKVKGKRFFPIFIDFNGGLTMGSGGLGFDICHLVNASIGYRINEKHAIGIAKTNFYSDNEITGLLGVVYRSTPTQRGIFTLEIGGIKKVNYGHIQDNSNKFEYLPNESQRYYFRLSGGYRFWRVFSLNFNYAQTGEHRFKQSKFIHPILQEVGKVKQKTTLFMWTLGVNIPVYPKFK